MSKLIPKGSSPSKNFSNKIFQSLICLSDWERKRLLKYLRSSYFLQSKPITALCEVLIEEIEKGRTGFDRQKAWQKLLINEPYNDVTFRKYCSDLLKYTCDFMAHESLTQNPIGLAIETLGFIVEHKIEILYNSSFQSANEKITNQPFSSASHFQMKFLLEKNYFSMMQFDMKADTKTNLEEISYNLDIYYWIEKLKICCSALSHQKNSTQKYNILFIKDIGEYLKQYPLEELPELAIYYYSYLTLFEGENIEHYFTLKRLLEKYGQIMPQKDAIELIDSILNYCASQINKGNRIFLQEYFDIFEDAVLKGIFLQNGTLATLRFNNILASALGLGKLEWAEKFIEDFKPFLPEESRENTYTFNLARVYRFQKKHDKVINLLQNVEYEDIHYNLISRMMLLITYYELHEFETLVSFMSSFRAFLTRHKYIPLQRRQGYLNLIKHTRHLIRLKPGDKTAANKLREEITREKSKIVNHEWLLEKLS